MNNFKKISFIVVTFVAIMASTSFAQVAPENMVNTRTVSDGIILVGGGSTDSQIGPYLGGSLGYGVGYGVTLYVESGFGWTRYHSVDGLRFVQIPVIGGATYNFGELWNSPVVQPYAGVAGGVFNYLLQQDWNTIFVGNSEQKTTSFGLEGIAGINFRITQNVGIDVRAKFDHIFSDQTRPGLESQEWSNVGVGGGISYNFNL